MSKFWTVVTVLVLIGVVLLITADREPGAISFSDLETECSYDRGPQSRIDLQDRGSLAFSGMFPVESTMADLDYSYTRSGDSIVLDIETTDIIPLTNFFDSCRGVVVYDAETRPIEEGVYRVILKHRGETIQDQVIDVQ